VFPDKGSEDVLCRKSCRKGAWKAGVPPEPGVEKGDIGVIRSLNFRGDNHVVLALVEVSFSTGRIRGRIEMSILPEEKILAFELATVKTASSGRDAFSTWSRTLAFRLVKEVGFGQSCRAAANSSNMPNASVPRLRIPPSK
jgi:hypothetical protein